jgi:PAS domain S-box-containing protein
VPGSDPDTGTPGGTLILFDPDEAAPNPAAALDALLTAIGLTLSNAQIVEQSHSAVSESAALREVATELATQHEPAALLDFIVNTARAVLGADYVGLAAVEANGEVGWRAGSGYRAETFRQHRIVPGLGTAGRVLQTRRPFVVENFGTNPDFPVDEFPVHQAEDAKAFFGVPLTIGARTFGAMTIGYRRLRSISARDLRLAATLADQAAVALEQGRLYTQARRQTHFLENIIQHVPAGIVVLTADDFRVVEANRFYLQFLDEPFRSGTRPLVGARVEEFLPQAEEAGILAIFRQVAAGAAYYRDEFEYAGFARGVTYWTWSVAPIYNDKGQTQSLLMLVVESTEAVQNRRRVAGALQQSEERARELETVINQMTDGVVIADATGRIVRVNPAGATMLGRGALTAPEDEYPQIYQVYTPDGRLYPWNELPLARAGRGHRVLGAELRVRHPNGSERVLSVSAAPLNRDDGTPEGAVAVLRDVTELKEADRLKDEFLAIVSHELRTPLSAILGYSDILLRGLHGPLNERQARAQMGVHNNAQRLLRIINDLLDVTKLEAQEVQLYPAPVSLAQAADTAIRAVQGFAASGKITLQNTVPSDLPPVLADDERLHQMLLNLLTNAIKFTPPGGRITLSAGLSRVNADSAPGQAEDRAAGPPRSAEITVQDTGIGLSEDQIGRIWERFYQADSTSSRSYGGTGLGLYIVRILGTLHGGATWATSPGPNQGTTIHLRLPLAQAPAASPPRPTLPTQTVHRPRQATRPRALRSRHRGQA